MRIIETVIKRVDVAQGIQALQPHSTSNRYWGKINDYQKMWSVPQVFVSILDLSIKNG